MTMNNGNTDNNGRLPPRGPGERLPSVPQLGAQAGSPPPGPAPSGVRLPNPDATTWPRVAEANRDTARVIEGVFVPSSFAEPVVPGINLPTTFEELLFWITVVTPAREVSTIVEQTIAPSATGSTTVSVPVNRVDIARFFREAGDGSVSYSIDVDSAGRTAIATHRITGGERKFARFYEKFQSVIVNFTNNDPVNAALIQIEWISIQMDTTDWQNYRDFIKAWASVLNVAP